jgi:HSP20 family protein
MQKDQVRKSEMTVSGRPMRDFTDQLIQPFSQLRTEVDRLFDDFPFRLPALRIGSLATAWPPVELSETDKAYKVTAELAGLDPENVDVSFDDGVLRIAGEKQEQREENEKGYHHSERSYGAFERLIRLPAAADEQHIKAKFKDGLLTVKVAKNGGKQAARKIKIEKDA